MAALWGRESFGRVTFKDSEKEVLSVDLSVQKQILDNGWIAQPFLSGCFKAMEEGQLHTGAGSKHTNGSFLLPNHWVSVLCDPVYEFRQVFHAEQIKLLFVIKIFPRKWIKLLGERYEAKLALESPIHVGENE